MNYKHDGQPFRATTALECLRPCWPSARSPAALPATRAGSLPHHTPATKVSRAPTNKLMAAKYPLGCLVLELAPHVSVANTKLSLSWVPCELNQKADDFAKPEDGCARRGVACPHRCTGPRVAGAA